MSSHHPGTRHGHASGGWTTALPIALGTALLAPAAAASPLQGMERRFGGETRQVFELTDGSDSHVWTVGDGAHIRYALNPQGDDWTVQSPPSDVTQTLLDVHFLDEDHGWACGVGGNVLSTSDGGSTWSHFDNLDIQNDLGEDAALWRVRFTGTAPSSMGFVCGLWTFKYWDGTSWEDVELIGGQTNEIEFYAMDIIVNPANPAEWIGVAAGQKWELPGGEGAGKVGFVYYTSSRAQDAATYAFGQKWELKHQTYAHIDPATGSQIEIEDPWDIEFEPNPTNWYRATAYLSGGGNNDGFGYTHATVGAVFRSEDSGRSWGGDLDNTKLPLGSTEDVATLYGVTAIDKDRALAVGYGGQVWYRDASGAWTEKVNNQNCATNPITCDWTGPLAGTNVAADGTLYAVGSWGFVRSSDTNWDTVDDLNFYQSILTPLSPEDWEESWRFRSVAFLDSNHGFAVGDKKAVAETNSAGYDFDYITGGPTLASTQFYDVAFDASGAYGVAVGATKDPGLTAPMNLDNALTYYYDSGTSTWSEGAHPSNLPTATYASVELHGVAWGSGEVWAVGTATEPQGGFHPPGWKAEKPLLLRSVDNGANWVNELPGALAGTIPDGVILNDVDFATSSPQGAFGVCVGFEQDTGNARAYVFRQLPGGVVILDVSPAAGGSLQAVTTNGTVTYAVGNGELILEYSPGSPFAPPSAVVPQLGGLDLVSADVTPSGLLLIGAQQQYEEPLSEHMGKLIVLSNGNWGTIPAGTAKTVRSIFLLDDDEGWLVGFSQGADPELGAVDDSVIEHFSGL